MRRRNSWRSVKRVSFSKSSPAASGLSPCASVLASRIAMLMRARFIVLILRSAVVGYQYGHGAQTGVSVLHAAAYGAAAHGAQTLLSVRAAACGAQTLLS